MVVSRLAGERRAGARRNFYWVASGCVSAGKAAKPRSQRLDHPRNRSNRSSVAGCLCELQIVAIVANVATCQLKTLGDLFSAHGSLRFYLRALLRCYSCYASHGSNHCNSVGSLRKHSHPTMRFQDRQRLVRCCLAAAVRRSELHDFAHGHFEPAFLQPIKQALRAQKSRVSPRGTLQPQGFIEIPIGQHNRVAHSASVNFARCRIMKNAQDARDARGVLGHFGSEVADGGQLAIQARALLNAIVKIDPRLCRVGTRS